MEKNQDLPIGSKEQLFEAKKMQHESLETEDAKQLASEYASLIHEHLQELNRMDSKSLGMAYQLLKHVDSYDKSQPDQNLEEGIKEVISLLEKTDSKPIVKLISLGDLLNESKVFLYPFSRLKPNIRQRLEEICEIALGLNIVSDQYVSTGLCSTFLAWGIAPIKGRDDINFSN